MQSVYNKKIKKCSDNQGFTIIETLVSLVIFSTSIIFLISVSASGAANATFSKNRMTASYLAEEGIELMRGLRDSMVLSNTTGGGWETFKTVTNTGACSTGCNIDPATLAICPCTGSTCQVPVTLYTESSSYVYYGYGPSCQIPTGQTFSPYTRTIKIESLQQADQSDGYLVTSTVSWLQGTVTKSIKYQTVFFNWEPNHAPSTGGTQE
ncbi:prepilin-type N-terminal cleavage/methylation domain-containing protein [Candidatus Nomurabacteria bacterium]|jgi:Tfp pilus assembly protein PilV|nr:MAG: prepilin-type N-terminal cleavage/methylation domain-containing protein [Candidatus Nomurabacteria bacterium]